MKVNDQRHQKQELSISELEAPNVYVSSRMQKYLMKVLNEDWLVCLETGQAYYGSEFDGDVFEPVNAVLEIK